MDRDSSDEDVDAPPQMALALVAPQAPVAMSASRRSASISCGKVLDYWAFVEELNMMFELSRSGGEQSFFCDMSSLPRRCFPPRFWIFG